MALLNDTSTNWSAPVFLTSDEIWQTRRGRIFVTSSTNPAADDGLELPEAHAVRLSAGLEVRYRKEGNGDAVIVREAI